MAAMPDPLFRAAAQDLFPLPYTARGWAKLVTRGRCAARRFGVEYDAFRRSAPGRKSKMESVLDEVAPALLTTLESVGTTEEPVEVPLVPAPLPPGDDQPPPDPPRRRTRWSWLLGAAGAALTGLAIWAFVAGGGHPSTPGCNIGAGGLNKTLSMVPNASRFTSRIRTVFAQVGGRTGVGCPSALTYMWGPEVVQELAARGVPNGAIVLCPGSKDADTYLIQPAWFPYKTIGDESLASVQQEAGCVDHSVHAPDDHVEIDLASGGVLVAEHPVAPYFWIPASYVSWWRRHPEMGLPTSRVDHLTQEFEHGLASVSRALPDGVSETVVPPTAAAAQLPPAIELRGHIIRQADSTAWYIDQAGKRQWIPDSDTWGCLGGDLVVKANNVPGYVVATLPFGGVATCGSSQTPTTGG
jgi:hypothetical protein